MSEDAPPEADDPQAPEGTGGHLVVVGASAGGVEALSTLVSGLPADFPAPLVLAQHLDPSRPSHLQNILQRRTSLPVQVAEDRSPMQPGTIYVVPANRHVLIQDGHMTLDYGHVEHPRPSIDLLLTTAARSYGDRLIAVVLTGAGSDGAAGAVDVKHAGGTVVIQNPLTARFPSMPSALPPTAVDHVADLENIAGLLDDLLRGPILAESHPKATDFLHEILAHVARGVNIDFRSYKTATLLRRVGRRMAVTHTTSLDDYSRFLQTHPEEVGELVRALLIKVTEFFRDPGAFHFLRDTALPEIVERARTRGRTLRLWSAGCATGEEAYSLILTVADLLGPELPEWNVRVFATDLDAQAVAFARRGLYLPNLLRNVPAEYRTRYFEVADHGLRVVKALRAMAVFGQQDLGRGVPFPRIDLITCRNLLIYFQPELQREVLDLFAYSLHPTNGLLLLGKAETARPSKSTFELVNKKWKIYRCLGGPVARNPRALVGPPRLGDAEPPRPSADALVTDPVVAPNADVSQLRRFTDLVLRQMPVGAIVIDRAYRTLTTNLAARRFLHIRDQADADFLHSVRGIPYTEVREAIDSVFREHAPISLDELSLEAFPAGDIRYVTMTISPMHEPSVGDLALVTVVDGTELVRRKLRLEASQKEHESVLQELSNTNKRVSDANKDLADANEGLQAANEELMLAQEELQATNEEFEATNEELQATNEELETNNEELQASNEELATTNDELTARTAELQEMTRQLTVEKTRLAEMIELAPFHMLLLRGPDLVIEAFNPSCGRLFSLEGALNRPLEDVLPESRELLEAIRNAYRNDVVWESKDPGLKHPGSTDGARYRVTIVPRHEEGRVDGVVVYAEGAAPVPRRTR